MKLFVVLVGLISVVPNSDGVTALLPNATKLGSTEEHFAEVGLELVNRIPSKVMALGPATLTDVAITLPGAAQAPVLGDYPQEVATVGRFVEFSKILGTADAAMVDDDCLAASPSGTCAGKLAGRVVVQGPVTVLPVNFMIRPFLLRLEPSPDPWKRLYAFVDTKSCQLLTKGGYQGAFSGAVFLSLDVAPAESFTLQVGGKDVKIAPSPKGECAEYEQVAGVKSSDQPCFLILAGDVPFHLNEEPLTPKMDHFHLLAQLLEKTPAVLPTMIWLNEAITAGDGFGTGPHVTCPGGKMENPNLVAVP